MLSTEYAWEFQNNALWDALWLARLKQMFFACSIRDKKVEQCLAAVYVLLMLLATLYVNAVKYSQVIQLIW